jgi:putative ABC transport system substrate-binding protein
MSSRRKLLVALGAGVLAAPFASFAQQSDKVWRIGYLALTSGPDEWDAAFRDQLRALGYVEGRNLRIEFRWAAGKQERVQELAEELVRLNVDAIVTRSTFVAAAAKRATSTIPIVMANASDPVGNDVIASLAHPGGNVTGMTQNSTELVGKRLQLLRELVPKSRRFAVLAWKKDAKEGLFIKEIRAAAKRMDVALVLQRVDTPEELAPAFSVMQRERAQALIVEISPLFTSNRKRIAELAAQHHLPSMFESRNMVDSGGLISYGASFLEMHRRAAFYVDRILKGAKPADLPVEQPTKFEMIINLKTGRALGLTIPQSILVQADELIQ